MEEYLKGILTAEIDNQDTNKKIEKMIFDIVFRHVKDLVFIMKVEKGPRFKYIFVNEMGLLRAGLNKQCIGKSLQEVLTHERAVSLQKEYERILHNNKLSIFSDEIFLDDGTSIFGESVLSPVKDETGLTRYVVSVTRDITDTLVEKNRLIISEQRYRSIVDHNLDAIFSIDLMGHILEVNPAARRLTGYTEKQLKKCSIFELVSDSDLPVFKSLLDNSEDGYALESLDCRFLHKNNSHLTVHIKTVPIIIDAEIKGIYVITRDVSEQAKNAETIKFMAFHDQLTGVLNRRALLDDLDESIATTKRKKQAFALISIDLDRFKYLNDTLGHLFGDEILKKVADRLAELEKKGCRVYRPGGDEFVILLHHADRKKTAHFAQKILTMFTESFYLQSGEYYITPSIGISMYPNDGNDAETLLKNADEALFRVKERGKAHFQFYRSDMNSSLGNVLTLETHLRKALERDELELYYQPQVNLASGEINSFEALIRWNSPELGFITPDEFIPLAEDTGLIVPIGNWVISTACKQIKAWTDKRNQQIRIAVNISPKQFLQPSLVNVIQTAIDEAGILPSSLEIEITEGAMEDTEETIPILNRLKELGIKISVDDFGTGYSSLNYLKQFPIDVLKIDQSFVRDILVNEKNAAITTTIIHLGRSLGMEVIAEGVENKEQADFLAKANCHKAQGYLFSKPLFYLTVEEQFI
ncbi:EAL domain-containing protein [Bacillus canaveralius]|uniref:EAL domain-containing protein n=1 Tax=Bacillus canaveralius TaxID=1403243 RepID=UPI00163984C1|nr:EAL domain-containing protein [Bacillus canaveralius]